MMATALTCSIFVSECRKKNNIDDHDYNCHGYRVLSIEDNDYFHNNNLDKVIYMILQHSDNFTSMKSRDQTMTCAARTHSIGERHFMTCAARTQSSERVKLSRNV